MDPTIFGPDDPDHRMVLGVQLSTGSVMSLERGDAQIVYTIDVEARTLGSLGERERRSYIFSESQFVFLAGQMMAVVDNIRSRP